MLVQVFARGIGGGSGPVDYVTGPIGLVFDESGKVQRDENNKPITYIRDPAPVVVSGDPDRIIGLIDSLDFKYKYTSGAIGFAPDDGLLTPEKEKEVIADFEKVAFAGLDRDQYAILWTRHTHQGHHELHFVMPRVELSTGKSLNAFPPNYQKYFDPWRSLWNEREGWADPDDPARARISRAPAFEDKIKAGNIRESIKTAENPRELITDYLMAKIETGMIQDRDGIIEVLEDAGLEINRQGKDYISVRPEPGAKPIRLKGVIYEQQFNSEQLSQEVTTEDRTGPRADREPDRERIEELERNIAEAVNRRTEYNRGRYQAAFQGLTQEHQSSIERTPEPGREFNEPVSAILDHTNDDRVEPLSGYLGRKLGPDYIPVEQHQKPTRTESGVIPGSRSTSTDINQDRSKDLGSGIQREQGREIFNSTARNGRSNWLDIQQWQTTGREAWEKLRGTYDRIRTAIIERIGTAIKAVRDGSEAAAATDRDLNKASESLKQTSESVERSIKRAGVIRMNRADELETFKTRINLVEYAAGKGYQIIKHESSRNSKIMEKDGDKVVIATGRDGHGIYFSVHDDRDNGSIIDFIQRRQNLNLGQVRKELRQFSGLTPTPIPALSKPLPSEKDIQQVIAIYSKTASAIPRYLTDKRGIDDEIIKDPRFSSVVRVDANKNAVFPHFNNSGLCGYELKNEGFTGFAKGGQKGVWHSSNITRAKTIVVCESAIDALSHAQIHDDPEAAYISIGGSMNENQPEIIKGLFKKAAERGVAVVLALDNDDQGRKFSAQMTEWANDAGVAHHMDAPTKGKDWNENLQIIEARHQDRGMSR